MYFSLVPVWSIVGTALEPTFDHEASSVMTSILKKHEIIHDNYRNMKNPRTKYSYRHLNSLHEEKVIYKDILGKVDDGYYDNTREAKYDKLYTATLDKIEQVNNLELHKAHENSRNSLRVSNRDKPVVYRTLVGMRDFNLKKTEPNAVLQRSKREEEDKCDKFNFAKGKKQLSHPGNRSGFYYGSVDCTTTIEGKV